MPCTLAMTGCGSVVMVIIMRLQRAKSDSTSRTSPMERISLRSCPAQNPRPLAASTTTLTVGSAARRSNVVCSSSMSALDSALNWPGRLSVNVATPSFVSVSSRASVCVVAFGVICLPPSGVNFRSHYESRCCRASDIDHASERQTARDQTVLVRLAFETLAKVRMRDADQCLGAFGDGLPLQIDHPILGHDEHDVRSRCRHDVALSQVQHDPATALAALVVGRGEADERLAAFGGVGAAHELQLAAGAAEMTVAVRFRRHLSLQVDLRCVVDRDHMVVLHDDMGRIRVVDGAAVHVVITVKCRVEIA